MKSVIGKLNLVLFGILFAIPISVFFIKSLNLFESGIGQLLLLFTVSFTFFVFWIKSYKITFREDKIFYKSIFNEETSVELSEIGRVKYKSGGSTHYERKSKLYPKILLYFSSIGEKRLIEITLNVFSYTDLQKFYDLLESADKIPFKGNLRKR